MLSPYGRHTNTSIYIHMDVAMEDEDNDHTWCYHTEERFASFYTSIWKKQRRMVAWILHAATIRCVNSASVADVTHQSPLEHP